jgi:hypothetical protein
MSFSIERLDSEVIAVVCTCVDGANRMCEHNLRNRSKWNTPRSFSTFQN